MSNHFDFRRRVHMALRAFSRNQSLPASPCTSEFRLKHRNAPRHPAPSRTLPRCAPTGRPKGVVMASAPARHLRQTWVPLRSSPPGAATPARPPTPAGAPGVSSRRSNARKAWGFASPPHWTFGIMSIGIGLRLIDPSRRQSNPATPSPNNPHRTKAEPQKTHCATDRPRQPIKKPRRLLVRACFT